MSAIVPTLLIDPELRAAAEDLLGPGETLSGFVETAVRQVVLQRQAQREFISRGIGSREKTRRLGGYVSTEDLFHKLDGRLAEAKARAKAKR